MSASKRKGTAAETAVVNYLQSWGYNQCERRALQGTLDRGDIAGIPGLVIEVKDHARMDLAAWVDEAEVEKRNDGGSAGVVWHKRRGRGDVGDWYVTMTGRQFIDFLARLYGGGR